MQIRTEGIVIREVNSGENDKYITILTSEFGTVEAFVKGARRKGSKLFVSTSLFSYSVFVLFNNKSKYYVDQADVINIFYDLRLDIVRLSTASYFLQVLCEIMPENDNCKEFLSLTLNSIHLLANTKKDYRIVKSVFELRCMILSGFCPNVVACNNCGYDNKKMFFYIKDGSLVCENCIKEKNFPKALLTPGVLAAIRHIVYSESVKAFSFTLDDANLILLGEVCETYLLYQTERNYKSLDFLKSLT